MATWWLSGQAIGLRCEKSQDQIPSYSAPGSVPETAIPSAVVDACRALYVHQLQLVWNCLAPEAPKRASAVMSHAYVTLCDPPLLFGDLM